MTLFGFIVCRPKVLGYSCLHDLVFGWTVVSESPMSNWPSPAMHKRCLQRTLGASTSCAYNILQLPVHKPTCSRGNAPRANSWGQSTQTCNKSSHCWRSTTPNQNKSESWTWLHSFGIYNNCYPSSSFKTSYHFYRTLTTYLLSMVTWKVCPWTDSTPCWNYGLAQARRRRKKLIPWPSQRSISSS